VILRETKERNGNFIHGHKVWGGGEALGTIKNLQMEAKLNLFLNNKKKRAVRKGGGGLEHEEPNPRGVT
jgi:hypothetical protein